ncbi:hypothetical protein KSP40_PGU020719 [Platanthera guangdongensis]|uniref:Uncharacterized protein n=1 Tax=Platanthera guangdongensis TaxID=2320717 RepID=A0ABR2LU75_9ASPA
MAADTPALAGERKLITRGEYGAEGCGCGSLPSFFPKNWENRWGLVLIGWILIAAAFICCGVLGLLHK